MIVVRRNGALSIASIEDDATISAGAGDRIVVFAPPASDDRFSYGLSAGALRDEQDAGNDEEREDRRGVGTAQGEVPANTNAPPS